MNLLHPRPAYSRADTDEPSHYASKDAIELSSIHTGYTSFLSDFQPYSETSSTHRLIREPTYDYAPPDFHPRNKLFAGWRFGAISAALLAIFSLLINVAAIIWLEIHPHDSNGLVQVYTGNCHLVRQMGLWVHLGINALSTLLLGGSNYCMQCLSSPTRREIDRAHAQGKYLDIGVPSARNLRSIATHKAVLWWILAISSVPLHLLYNSAFYGSLSTNDYDIFIAEPAFVSGNNYTTVQSDTTNSADIERTEASTNGSFHRLELLDCINQYAQVILTDRRNLVLVSANGTPSSEDDFNWVASNIFSTTVDYATQSYNPFDWICTSDPYIDSKIVVPNRSNGLTAPCDDYVSRIENIVSTWVPFNHSIEYCLSERVSETCSFNGNIPIILVVIACNLTKAVVMLIVAFRLKGHPLITIGDAIESFLNRPDITTKGRCWMTRAQAADYATMLDSNEKKYWPVRESVPKDHPSTISTDRQRWLHAASRSRWIFTTGLVGLALVVSIVFLGLSVQTVNIYGGSIWSLGIGQVHASAIISGWAITNIVNPGLQILASILVANLPQAILSFLYLNLNGLLTSMWVAAEWSDFAMDRKHLRVSNPKGNQRSTHFLQLPYKIAMPLMVISGSLHWLVSQSVFLAVVAEYSSSGNLLNATQIASCGFSPIAMIITIGLGSGIVLATFLIGRRRYTGGIPLVGSCSAAISAACHRPDWDQNAALCAVRYGVIPGIGGHGGVGHCSFTSGEVEAPLKDTLYAGL